MPRRQTIKATLRRSPSGVLRRRLHGNGDDVTAVTSYRDVTRARGTRQPLLRRRRISYCDETATEGETKKFGCRGTTGRFRRLFVADAGFFHAGIPAAF